MGVGNLHHRKASTPAPATTRRSPLHPQLPKGRLLVYANRLQRVERIGGRAMYRVALGVEAHCVAANLGDDRRRHRPPFRSCVRLLNGCGRAHLTQNAVQIGQQRASVAQVDVTVVTARRACHS